MKIQSIIAAVSLVLAVGPSFAADPPNGAAPLTRAQVKQSVLDARAAGELRPPGEDLTYPASAPHTTGKPLKFRRKATSSTASSLKEPASKTP